MRQVIELNQTGNGIFFNLHEYIEINVNRTHKYVAWITQKAHAWLNNPTHDRAHCLFSARICSQIVGGLTSRTSTNYYNSMENVARRRIT